MYGATYDSTEHFWQAVKYHPDVTVADLLQLLSEFGKHDWSEWLARLDVDPKLCLTNAYAIEFLRHNLAADRLRWFSSELQKHQLNPDEHARRHSNGRRLHSASRLWRRRSCGVISLTCSTSFMFCHRQMSPCARRWRSITSTAFT